MIERIDAAMQRLGINETTIAETWKEIVMRESFTREPVSIAALSDYLRGELEAIGFETRTYPFEQSGPLLIGEMGQGDKSEGIILTGHIDTVLPPGTTTERPFRIDGDVVTGPGVLDMKGGVALILHIARLLKELGFSKPVKVILVGDEEHGHAHSNAAELMKEESAGYKCAFNMESGLVNNGITIARKGRIEYLVKAHGKSAHAGANFHDGVNAICEMAHLVLKINALNEKYDTATFSVGIIKGGSIANAVPHYAEAIVDIRYFDTADGDRIHTDIQAIVNQNTIPGATAEAALQSVFPPFMDTLNARFYDVVNATSEELGYGTMPKVRLGGSSDASHLTEAGIPVLCSMGVKGEWNHTDREYALLSSTVERVRLITASILKIEHISL